MNNSNKVKWLFFRGIIIGLLFSKGLLAMCQSEIEIGLHGNTSQLYKKDVLNRMELLDGTLPEKVLLELPIQVTRIRVRRRDEAVEKWKRELEACETKLKKAYLTYLRKCADQGKSDNPEEFRVEWERSSSACYGVYAKSAPDIFLNLKACLGNRDSLKQVKGYITEVIHVTRFQSSGNAPRLVGGDILLKAQIGLDTIILDRSFNTLALNSSCELWLKIWSTHYAKLPIGRIPHRLTYVLRIGVVLDGRASESVHWTEWFLIEV